MLQPVERSESAKHVKLVTFEPMKISTTKSPTTAQLTTDPDRINPVREERELVVDLPPPAAGTTTGVLEMLAACGVAVHSCLQYGNLDQLLLVTDAPDKAARALQSAGYRCRMENVVLVDVAAGDRWAGLRAGQALHTGGVKILHSYVSRTAAGHGQAVFQTANNRQALNILISARLTMEA